MSFTEIHKSASSVEMPILCFDTCTLLDIIRDPTRDMHSSHDVEAGLKILEVLENKKLIGVIAKQVSDELLEHTDRIQRETDEVLNKLQKQISRVNKTIGLFGAEGITSVAHWSNHALRARVIVDRLLAASYCVCHSSSAVAKAMDRSLNGKTPSSKGKDSVKDCLIIETYLESIQLLRTQGLMGKVVFTSSNTKDYSDSIRRGVVKQDLAAEFFPLTIEYASSLGMAKHLLGI
jgi:PIN domain